MTLAEFQPHVERAVAAVERSHACSRRLRALQEERAAIEKSLRLAGLYGIEAAPLERRLAAIRQEMTQDITDDQVSVLPLRSVPMDMIAEAVVRRILKVPLDITILGLNVMPSPAAIEEAVQAIASRWKTPNGQSVAVEPARHE
jgi:hypothetical protein